MLDDTLRENQGAGGLAASDPRGAAAAAALRQSREAMSELWSKASAAAGGGLEAAQEQQLRDTGHRGHAESGGYGLASYS